MSLNDSRTTLFGPYSFINISCGKEEIDDVQYGWKNMVEVILVTRIVQNLYKVIDIKELQGEKIDIIVLSTVRSNSDGTIGLLSNPERVNRAFTSARDCLWILGDERTLSRGTNSFWKLIIRDAKGRKCFFNVEQHKDLGKFVGEVKKELDQLDELLNPDSILFMNAKWKVSFSDNFVKSFEKIKSSQKKNLVMNMLLRLANGWRPKRGVLITCDESKQTLKQCKVKDLHVICSIDIEKEQYWYVQVLKVWDVLPPVDVSKLVKLLDTVFLTYVADDLNRCKTKCVEGDLEVPMSWETSHDNVYYEKHNHIEEGIRFTTEPFDYSIRNLEDFKMTENLQLMKFYPLTSDMVRHLLSDSSIGTEMILPFKLTNQEIEAVHFDRTSFILGRSGTGKTTVLIRKLFHKEQLYHLTSEGFHVLDSCTTNEKIKEDDESVKEGEETFLRQIFVTVNPILCGAVKEHVEGLKRFACGGKSAENSVSDSDVPDSFKGLHRSLFPLVISYHKFLMMLDGTLGNSFFDRFPEATRGATSLARENFIRMKEVNFDKFEQSYWPHFNRKITKSLPSSIVFAEIMSCIKGGLQALSCHEGNLSREDYISLSNRRISNLDEQAREHVYDIFLHYERKKKMNSEYVWLILSRIFIVDLEKETMRPLSLTDLTMRQIALFKYICRNVNHGFVFSGDTAQTIAKGVDFRFEDIRHLFYKEFVLKSRSGKNYVRGEKDSIDVLSPETSHIMGETPSLLVQSCNDKITFTSMLSNAGDCGKKLVGFGHDQVVLVRDDSVKEILESAGTEAIIMTISECKGLEFQDVLLYNFVSSSPLKDNWRVIDKYMKDKHFLDRGSSRSSPSFDVTTHRLLCSELKQLYVAITRTRRRLLFFEKGDSDGFSNPIYDYWEKLRLVQYQTLDHSFVKKIQVHSTKEEWKSSGNEYFIKKKYKAAKECFHKAGETLLEQKAEAFFLRASAQSTYSTNFDKAEMYLNKAAKIFKSFGMFEQAVQCFYDSKNYAMAGSIYLEHYGETKLLEAGECFTRARSYDRAAFAYAKGNSFSNCLESCIQGKLFIKGLDYLSQWKEFATLNNDMERQKEEIESTEMKILTGAAHTYKRLGDKMSMMKCVKAFHFENSKRSFLRTGGFLEELLQLEIELGYLLKAAKIAKRLGKTLHAADLLEKAGHFKDASELIMSHVLANSICTPSKGWSLKQFPGKEELLDKAMSLENSDSSHFFEFVSMQRKVLVDEKVALSELLQLLSYFKRYRSAAVENSCERKILDHYPSVAGEILCERKILDHFFGIFLNVTDLKMHAGNEFLETLVSVWNNWKENIEKITNYLSHVRSHDEYGNFCLSYLGVVVSVCYGIKEDMYLLLDPNAIWVKQIINRHLHRQGKLVFCNDKQFSRAAKSYWSEEVKSVGENVFEILKECWEDKSLHLYGRTFALTHLNGFENSLEFLQEKNHDEVSQHLIKLSTNIMGTVFPLDWLKPLTLEMTNLRETKEFRIFLEDIVCKTISSLSHLTYEAIGNVVMTIIGGSRRFSDETYKKISLRCDNDPFWKSFFKSFVQVSLTSQIKNFYKALKHTYYADSLGERDYISPSSFMYIFERVLIMVFYLKGFFFSIKTSLFEWLIHQEWNKHELAKLHSHYEWQQMFVGSLDIMAAIVFELLCNEGDVITWIKNSKLSSACHQLLVLRLFVALCLLYLNTGNYYELLVELLGRKDITCRLPPEFYNVIQNLKPANNLDDNAGVLAEALEKIGNPLAIVNSGKCCTSFEIEDAIFVDLDVHQGREKLLSLMLSDVSSILFC
ncbi:uncharacterized protein LOC133825698 [Humulus lupulus]|uniref:uncharacterized protein LOC133825698 n=1 Tax=Humulus lupulus TaxID=3486 RepID=UPI002B40EEBD|nr:uncharacterized protein LOC133825698 [Humulus lupulus]